MPRSFTPLLLVILIAFASDLEAYVVIDNFQAGAGAYGQPGTPDAPRRSKPTGVVTDEGSSVDSDDQDFVYPGNKESRSRKPGRSRDGRSRYVSSNRSRGGGGGGGVGSAGGGFGGGRRNDPSRGGVRENIVDVDRPRPRGGKPEQQDSSRGGRDLTKYGSGPGGNGGGSPGSPLGNPGGQPPIGGGGGPSKPTATPEPAALAIWMIAGSCGYGLLRFRHKWLPLE